MELKLAEKEQIKDIVKMSVAAFDSDVMVGASSAGGPPEYENEKWHVEMMEQGHLYTAMDGENLIGAALLFVDEKNPKILYVGRIFVKTDLFRKGYGIQLMKKVEENFPDIKTFMLDTPVWNVRTNSFYKKVGYKESSRDRDFVYYVKYR